MAPPGIYNTYLSTEGIANLDKLTAVWVGGLRELESWRDRAPDGYRELATIDCTMTEAVYRNLLSVRLASEWSRRFGKLDPLNARATLSGPQAERAQWLLEREIANTRRTVEIFSRSSVFRFHPYYRNWFALPVLVRKEIHLARALDGWDR